MLTGFDITELLCMSIFDEITEEGTDKVWIIGIEQLKGGSYSYMPFEIEDSKVLHANSYITFEQMKQGKDGPLFQLAFKYDFFDKILYNGNLIILAEIVVHELYEVQDDAARAQREADRLKKEAKKKARLEKKLSKVKIEEKRN